MPPTKHDTTRARILKAVASYPRRHNGHEPRAWQIAVVTGLHTTTVQFALERLQRDGVITITSNRITIVPQAGETRPDGLQPAAADSTAIDPGDHEPPAERAAVHYQRAAITHLGTIETQHREIDALRAELKTIQLAGGWARRHELEIADLKAENARLRDELQAATDAWRSYQRRAYIVEAKNDQAQQELSRARLEIDWLKIGMDLRGAKATFMYQLNPPKLARIQLQPVLAII